MRRRVGSGRLTLLVTVILSMGAIADESRACVQCDTISGDCESVLPHLSGNCECIIKEKFGNLICTPSGVCDPQDPNTCGGGMIAKAAPGPAFRVDVKSLAALSEHHPLLRTALYAASESTLLRNGDTSGTIKLLEELPAVNAPVGTVFTYETQVHVFSKGIEGKQASDWVTFYVRLENTRTGEISEYDGQLLKFGRQGSVTPKIDGVSGDVMSWDVKK